MCSLCGILAGRGHWTESASSPEVFAGRTEVFTAGRERQHRTRILNVVLGHYGLSLSDWTAGKSVLRALRDGLRWWRTSASCGRRRNGWPDALSTPSIRRCWPPSRHMAPELPSSKGGSE